MKGICDAGKLRIWHYVPLIIYVFVISFVLSIDSYSHDFYDRVDSSFFFMDGKALANGFRPYIDFMDIKGPLLFLLYGAFYAISQTTYLGAFYGVLIFTIISFVYYYKISRLFLGNVESFLSTVLVGFVYFSPWINKATEAEDFCSPVIAASVYYFVKNLVESDGKNGKKSHFLVWGLAFGWCLMIKYSIAAMLLVIPLVQLAIFVRFRLWKNLFRLVILYVAGVAVICIPILIYLVSQGALWACIEEYFLYAYGYVSVTSEEVHLSYWNTLCSIIGIYGWNFRLVYIVSAISCLFYLRRSKILGLSLFAAAVWFIALSLYHHLEYYMRPVNVWCVFATILLLGKAVKLNRLRHLSLGGQVLTSMLFAILVIGIARPWQRTAFFTNRTYRENYYECASFMKQIKNPTIVTLDGPEMGLGMLSEALPGCKYYARFWGAKPECKAVQREAICSRRVDFVITPERELEFVKLQGYVPYMNYLRPNSYGADSLFCICGRPGLKVPHVGWVTDRDVLLKRFPE